MAVNVGSVEVLLTLRDALSAALAKPQANLVKLSAEVNKVDKALRAHEDAARRTARAHDNASSAIDKFGKQVRTTLVHVLAAGAAYKALAAASKSVTDVVELVRTFEKIENVTGVTREEVDRLRSSLNTLSTATGKGPQELAEGFYSIASAGVKGAEATEILTAAARASAVGLGDTKDIARSITAAITAYGKENLSAAQAADVLFATVREGAAEASEVAGVFGRVVGVASQLGVSFQEVGSFIATFTRLGVGADEAVTALRGSLMAMLTPTRNQENALKAVGMSMDGLRQSVREKGLTAALIELTRASQGNEDVIGAVIPNVRALAGVLGVAGKQADAYAEVTDKVTNSTGDLGRAFDDVSKSASFQWDKLRAQFEQLSLSLGQQLLPGVIAFREAIASMDEGELQQLGADAANVLTALAKVLEVVVTHLDTLKAAIMAVLALKVVTAIGAWVTALGAVPPVAAAATTGIAALGVSISAVAGPIGIAVASFVYLNSKIKQFVAEAQRDINLLVESANKAGAQFAKFLALRQGRAAGVNVAVSEEEYTAALAERNRLMGLILQSGGKVNADLVRQKKQVDEIVMSYEAQKRVVDGIGGAVEDVGKKIAIPNAAAEQFLQRTSEVLSKLKDQLEASRAELTLAKARRDEGEGAVDVARQLSVEARAQLEVTKVLNTLESSKHRLTAATRAEVVRLVTEWVRVKDEIKQTNDEVRKQEAETRSQERALAQMYRIIEKRAEHERKIRSELQAQAEALQEQFAIAAINLDTSKKMLAALLSHGQQAARAAEIQGELEKEHVLNARELSVWLAQVEEEQAKINYLIEKVGELSKPAWRVYLDAAFDAINAVGDALSDVLYQAAMEGKVNWESVWEGLKSSLIKIFADMLADMLKRWIATQLAMRAASESINAGGGATGGGGGLTGAFSSMGMSAFGGTSGGGGASASTLAGWAVAAFALYVVYKGFIEDHKRKFAGVTLGDAGQVTSSSQHGKKYMDGLLKTVDALLESLRAWLKEFDIEMTKFANLTIEADKSGYSLYGANGVIIGHFKSAEEAISAANAFMIKFGEFADSVPDLVRSAIAASDMNMESITSNVQFARTLLTQNMEQVALAIHDATELFVDQIRRSFELFGQIGRNFNGPALLEATGSAILYFTNSLQQLYNQLTGVKEDPRQAAERQRLAYNAQRAIMIAQITLLIEEIKARIALYQAQLLTIAGLRGVLGDGGGGGGGTGGAGTPDEAGVPSPHGISKGGADAGGRPLTQDSRNPTNDPQLAALLQILDALIRALGGIPGEIGPGGVKPGKPGGGGGGARQQVRDFIEQQRFALAQAGRSVLQQEIEEIRRSFKEQLENAGKNVKLRQELLALEQQAIEAARKRFQEDVENRFKEITGQTNAFTELRKRFADMRRDILDAGFAASKAAEMLAALAEAEKEAVRVLSEQMTADLLGGLAQYIEDETVRAEFLKQAAIIKFNLDMANYKAQFAILKAMGTLAPEVLAGIQKAFDWIEAHPPSFDSPSGGGSGSTNATPPPFVGTFVGERTVWDGWVWTWNGSNWLQGNQHTSPQGGGGGSTGGGGPTTGDSIARARELLQRYQDEGLNRWQRALTELDRDFEQIRHWLGDTPEVANAYADALRRLREEFLEGLRTYYDELRNFGASQSVAQQFEAARARYGQLLGMVQGGDLSQADALQSAAAQLEQLAQQMFGTATGGYQDIRARILADLESILGIVSPAGGNVIGGPEWFTSGNAATVAATTAVSDAVNMSAVSRDRWLQKIDEKLSRLVGDVETPPTDGTPFSYGDVPRRLPGRVG